MQSQTYSSHGSRLTLTPQAVRRQGMRVGSAMSRVLSPDKPALFAEEECLWDLLPEERWEQQQQHEQQSGAAGAKTPKASATEMRLRADRAANGVAPDEGKPKLRKRRQRTRGSGTRGREEEQEGVLTETDSDDEGGGWGSGSSDGGEFEAYDLDESDEDGEQQRAA